MKYLSENLSPAFPRDALFSQRRQYIQLPFSVFDCIMEISKGAGGETEMAESNTSNFGLEKQIWDAACVLRGNMDASEYKSVVLGLIFLKYISDRFEAKYNELVAEGEGFEEDIDEYASENIFFVPENARWSVISAAAHTPEIGTVIDDAMRSIEKRTNG